MTARWCVLAVLVVACSKEPSYQSNFGALRVDRERHAVLERDSGKPYSGPLVARDREIVEVSGVLGEPVLDLVAGTDPSGLVLVAKVEQGALAGTAQLLVDLRAPKLSNEIMRQAGDSLAIARTLMPQFVVAEATFAGGKLVGPAVAYVPDEHGKRVVAARATFVDDRLHGPSVEYYPGTQQPHYERNFEAGQRAGVQKSYHRNGKLAMEATFVAGAPHGDMTELYATGAKRSHRTFDKGNPVGLHEGWFPNGKKAWEASYADGEPRRVAWHSNGAPASEPAHGVIEEFYASGQVQTRTTYEHGVKHGPFEQLYENQKPWKRGTYRQGAWDGTYEEWWKNGKPALRATYANGNLTGDYKRWYANGGDHESASYVDGKRHGPYRKWWKNGKPAHVYDYKDGKLDGEYRQFYDTGAKWAVARYVAGKPQGAIERWFPDGKLGYVMNHVNGRPHGEYKRWWADGKPRLVATYVDGVLDGTFENWLEDGTLVEKATYQRGLQTSTTRRDSGAAR